jgi:two-component system response regulator DesR
MMRLFIADDSAVIRSCLVDLLSDIEGIDIVGQAGDWPGAAKTIQRLKPDVAILDIQMPEGNGLVALRTIKKNEYPPKVIMFTNYSYPHNRKEYIEAGADYFFDKCSEYKELEDVLKRLIRDSAPIKQTIQAD